MKEFELTDSNIAPFAKSEIWLKYFPPKWRDHLLLQVLIRIIINGEQKNTKRQKFSWQKWKIPNIFSEISRKFQKKKTKKQKNLENYWKILRIGKFSE